MGTSRYASKRALSAPAGLSGLPTLSLVPVSASANVTDGWGTPLASADGQNVASSPRTAVEAKLSSNVLGVASIRSSVTRLSTNTGSAPVCAVIV